MPRLELVGRHKLLDRPNVVIIHRDHAIAPHLPGGNPRVRLGRRICTTWGVDIILELPVEGAIQIVLHASRATTNDEDPNKASESCCNTTTLLQTVLRAWTQSIPRKLEDHAVAPATDHRDGIHQ
jgi:hypothetical protein